MGVIAGRDQGFRKGDCQGSVGWKSPNAVLGKSPTGESGVNVPQKLNIFYSDIL